MTFAFTVAPVGPDDPAALDAIHALAVANHEASPTLECEGRPLISRQGLEKLARPDRRPGHQLLAVWLDGELYGAYQHDDQGQIRLAIPRYSRRTLEANEDLPAEPATDEAFQAVAAYIADHVGQVAALSRDPAGIAQMAKLGVVAIDPVEAELARVERENRE